MMKNSAFCGLFKNPVYIEWLLLKQEILIKTVNFENKTVEKCTFCGLDDVEALLKNENSYNTDHFENIKMMETSAYYRLFNEPLDL